MSKSIYLIYSFLLITLCNSCMPLLVVEFESKKEIALFEVQEKIDQISVFVNDTGDLRICFSTFTDNLFINLQDIPLGFEGASIKFASEGYLRIRFNLKLISKEQAKLASEKLTSRLTETFGFKVDFQRDEIQRYISPTGIHIERVIFHYKIIHINKDFLINKIKDLKPNEGFMMLIDEEYLWKANIIELYIVCDPHSREIALELTIIFYFPNYYNFKPDKIYFLDLLELFNCTQPIKTHSKILTGININFKQPKNMDLIFIEIDLPMNYYTSKSEKQRIYSIFVDPWSTPLQGYGLPVKRIFIKFKIVESGYILPIALPQILGYVLIALIIGLLGFIFYRFKSSHKSVK